ncbi:MAG: hypothetical protein WCT31_05110 [Candidatus Micrarchaeia archaeon]|jgi:hypothetical protein
MRFGLFSILLVLLMLPLLSFALCPDGSVPSGGYDATGNPVGCGGTGGTGGTVIDPAGASGSIQAALQSLCQLAKNILGTAMMFMVVTSALVYAVGQTMGAETRARASVWATSMFNGAIIAALIYILVPFVINKMLEGQSVPDVTSVCFFFF